MEEGKHDKSEHHTSQDRHWIVAAGALESAQSYLAGSAGPSAPRDGSSEAFSSSFAAFVEWAIQNRLIRAEAEFPFLKRIPDASGEEHEAWFDEDSNLWFKLTYRNHFGLAWGRSGSATAGEYVSRLLLQNTFFEDDIRLVAVLNCGGALRVLTSQPHIMGEPPSQEDIVSWFGALGFSKIAIGSGIAWYHRAENLLVGDAHEGNIIKTPNGCMVPIDLNLIHPTGKLLKWVTAASAEPAAN